MALSSAFRLVATKLQEATQAKLANSDVCKWLADALNDEGDCWYLDHIAAEASSGTVIYASEGDFKQAPYTITQANGKASATINTDRAVAVLPRTAYVKQGEAAPPPEPEPEVKPLKEIELTGDLVPLKEGAVGQDGTAYLKLIAPGRGSSGWYPKEVLQRDGPTVFKSGTKNFWNHQTDAEEAARPEGDLRDLASVLTEDAHYEEMGPAGPGLYARAKVFEHFRPSVDQLAKHIGMSIRASGKAKEGKAPDGKTGPIIEQLTRGLSVDYVTTPGAGGQILQLFEAARSAPIPTQGAESDMDEATAKKLLESNRKLSQRLALREARDLAAAELTTLRLPDATKTRLIERVVGMAPINVEGELDTTAFKALIAAEAKDEATYLSSLTGGQIVTGMGSADGAQPTAEQLAEAAKDRKREGERFAETMGFDESQKAGRRIMMEGRSAFNPNYNSSRNGAGVTVED